MSQPGPRWCRAYKSLGLIGQKLWKQDLDASMLLLAVDTVDTRYWHWFCNQEEEGAYQIPKTVSGSFFYFFLSRRSLKSFSIVNVLSFPL